MNQEQIIAMLKQAIEVNNEVKSADDYNYFRQKWTELQELLLKIKTAVENAEIDEP